MNSERKRKRDDVGTDDERDASKEVAHAHGHKEAASYQNVEAGVVRLKIDGKIINDNHQLLFEILEGELQAISKMTFVQSADDKDPLLSSSSASTDESLVDASLLQYRGICLEALPPYDFRYKIGDTKLRA